MGEHAGIWLRVSTRTQDEASQLPDVAAWVASHGYETAATYTVHGGSAFKGNRKFDRTWASVLDDMRNGRVTVLVVWKQDRIDRKLHTFAMLAEVVAAGGRVEFVTQPHLNDLTTMGGRISLKVQEEIAYAESKDKSDRIRAKQAALRAGGHLVGRPPFGYVSQGPKDARAMVATAEGERLIPELYARIAAGESLDTAAAWLGGQTGRAWHGRVVAVTIRNPSYRGARQDAAGRTIHTCPALVSGAVWRRAVAALDARPSSRRGQRTDRDAAPAAILSGITLCGNPDCDATGAPDSPMCKSNRYYRCTGRGAQRRGCGYMIGTEAADALMDSAMSGLLDPVTRPVPHPATGHGAELADIDQRLRELPAQGLDRAAESAERERLWAEQDRLAAEPATPAWVEQVPVLDAAGEPLTYGAKWERSTPAGRRTWLREAGFSAYLVKPADYARLPEEDESAQPAGVSTRFDAWTSEHAALIFSWAGDEDEGLGRGL